MFVKKHISFSCGKDDRFCPFLLFPLMSTVYSFSNIYIYFFYRVVDCFSLYFLLFIFGEFHFVEVEKNGDYLDVTGKLNKIK